MQTTFEPTLWFWLILGLALLGLEVVVPGMILMWFGIGALITGALLAFFPDMSLATQLISFAVLSVASLIAWRKSKWREEQIQSDKPELNQRLQNLLDKEFVLTDAIQNGRGTDRHGDRRSGPSGDGHRSEPRLAAGYEDAEIPPCDDRLPPADED